MSNKPSNIKLLENAHKAFENHRNSPSEKTISKLYKIARQAKSRGK
jgi:hypothetical protein